MSPLCRTACGYVVLSIASVGFAQPPGGTQHGVPPDGMEHGMPLGMPSGRMHRPPNGGAIPDGPMPLFMLAAQKPVQADLKLKPAQTQQIATLDDKMKQTGMEAMRGGPQAMQGAMESAMQNSEKELAKVLSEEQLARLRQTALQVQGPHGLLVPETAKTLELNDEQTAKIKALTAKDEKKVNSILTEEQREKWREMTGKPLRRKISMPPPGPPMPRR